MRGRFSGVRWCSGFVGVLAVSLACVSAPTLAETYLVQDQAAYADAHKRLQPGDMLVLASGVWQDFEILFEAQGDADKPITLRAESPGTAVISGRSNLRIAGEHLVVEGLSFKNGFSPTRAVISFRSGDDSLANHTRLTQVAIEGFSKTDRTEEDVWVALYGKNNRIDHSYFAGKTNKGPTMVVRLNSAASRENNHVVEYNYFGHRPSIGGNGGETLRIGVSDYSRTQSQTKVLRNYFERCDGEVEIISIKAEGNLVAENVFYESRGAVVFRHGGNNEVSRNLFFGNGVSDTGGVRVINDRQTVKDNYFEALRGEKFLSALTIMNGVPDSPINRYHQVKDAEISNNSFVGFDAIGLAVGSDEERSAAPLDSVVQNNLFITDAKAPVSVFDDISGIGFKNNVSDNPAMAAYAASDRTEIKLARAENGLLYPTDAKLASVGAPRDLNPIRREETGPGWFEKPQQVLSGSEAGPTDVRVVRVKKGADALVKAVAESQPGDVLRLRGKRYALTAPLLIPHPLTIEGRPRFGRASRLSSAGTSVFALPAGSGLTLSNLELLGRPENAAVIAATGENYKGAYSLKLVDVRVLAAEGIAQANKTVSLLAADAATFATSVDIERVTVRDWPGTFVSLSGAELEGWYLAEDISIRNSSFTNLSGPLLSFGREGRDESTFGPRVLLTGSTLDAVNWDGRAIDLQGIDGVKIRNNVIRSSGTVRVKKRVLGLTFEIDGNSFDEQGVRPTPIMELLGVNDEPLNSTGKAGSGGH